MIPETKLCDGGSFIKYQLEAMGMVQKKLLQLIMTELQTKYMIPETKLCDGGSSIKYQLEAMGMVQNNCFNSS
jgi:Fe2+ transport system protein FeoA